MFLLLLIRHFPVVLREVALPPMLIAVNDPMCPRFRVSEETNVLHYQWVKLLWRSFYAECANVFLVSEDVVHHSRGLSMYSSILEHLHRLKRDIQTDNQAVQIGSCISQVQVWQLLGFHCEFESGLCKYIQGIHEHQDFLPFASRLKRKSSEIL